LKYLLDTDVIINHIRGKKRILDVYIEKGSSISVITQAELYYGARKSTKRNALISVKNIIKDLKLNLLDLDEEAIDVYSKTKVKLERQGKRLDDFDILIASTAISEKLILVSENKKHFERISKLRLI